MKIRDIPLGGTFCVRPRGATPLQHAGERCSAPAGHGVMFMTDRHRLILVDVIGMSHLRRIAPQGRDGFVL